jgi:hypothetical protein
VAYQNPWIERVEIKDTVHKGTKRSCLWQESSNEGSPEDSMPTYKIPFNKPYVPGNEMCYIQEAIDRGHISGDGYSTKKCQNLFEEILGVPKVLLTTSRAS